ncbi:hypothetical protein [Frankia sp. Cj3]|uniref:hypothetical protein n=1 Tax=Frankia sp. Cj3 TaxID=2880976 RepID=UPI001EF4B86F|nr:hypothetical protein [Frankia sp. Cj3]
MSRHVGGGDFSSAPAVSSVAGLPREADGRAEHVPLEIIISGLEELTIRIAESAREYVGLRPPVGAAAVLAARLAEIDMDVAIALGAVGEHLRRAYEAAELMVHAAIAPAARALMSSDGDGES